MPLIKGEVVNLRSLKKTDACEIYKNLKDKKYYQIAAIPQYSSIKQGQKYIKLTHQRRRKGTDQAFAITRAGSGRLCGMLGLHTLKTPHKSAEIGYWVAKDHWGQGLATQAVELALRFAFGDLKLHRVYARVFPRNRASIRVLEKAGFQREGLLRQDFRLNHQFEDVVVFGILRDEMSAVSRRKIKKRLL